MTSLADVQGLSNRPATPDCVKWSEDGVVAVAAAHSVVLLNPADLSGPRAFASAGNQCDLSVLQAPGMPADPTADAHHELAHLRQGAMVSQYPLLQLSLQARSLAWSPAGCAATAGCLLATVTNDHQVLVYGPPSGPMTEWQQVADLSEQLLLHLGQTGWQDLDPQQLQGGGGGDGGDSTLRLRGGGRSKRPAQRKGVEAEAEDGAGVSVHRPEAAFNVAVGQAVEVMTAEEGLEGCWFTGAIQALSGGWALVAYDELQESEEEGAGKLREWFPVPGQHQAAAPAEADGGAQHTVHATASGHELRPAPPAKKSGVGASRRPGDVCDSFIDSGWWEGCRVVELQEGGAKVEVEVAGERHVVERAHTRRCLLFQNGQWQVLVAAASAAPGEAGGTKRQADGGEKQAAPACASWQEEAEEPAQAAAAAAPEAAEPADEPPTKRRRARKPGGGGKAAAAGGPEPAPSREQQQQQEGFAAGHGGEAATQQQESQAQQRRAPAGGSKLQQLAAAAAAGTPVAAGTPAASGSQPPATSARAKGKAAGRGGGGGSSAKKAPPPVYHVPPDFDAAVLPAVDLSSLKGARVSVPLAFCRRFLVLRREVPEEELPRYEATSSHLKGIDAQLVAQAVAEILHVHGAALAALSPTLNAKWLNTEGRQRLRLCWDRTRNKVLGRFGVAEGDPSEASSEEEAEEGRRSGGGMADEDEEATESEGEGGSGRQRSGRPRRASVASLVPQLDFPPHQLPEGFSWRDLPGVDPSNAGVAKASLILAAVRRFLILRSEFQDEQLPVYETTSSHLRGRDAWLVERVTREFTTAYAQLVSDLKWEAKSFQTDWLARLRGKWDKMTGQVAEGFGLEPEVVDPSALLLVGGDAQEEEEMARRGPRMQNRPRRWAKKVGSVAGRRSLPAGGGARGQAERRGGSDGTAGSSEDESDGGASVAAAQRKRGKKDLAAATAAQRLRSAADGALASPAYQLRLLGASSLSCAWSPAVPGAGGGTPHRRQEQQQEQGGPQRSEAAPAGGMQRCCFLAVGAKAGRVWLWRYRLPQQYSLPLPAGQPGGMFELVACLAGSPGAWVSSLAWQLLPGGGGDGGGSGSLVLAVGCSDGSVVLYGAEARQLAALPGRQPEQQEDEAGQQAGREPVPPLPAGMQRWCVACHPDLRGVAALAVQLHSTSRGGSRLLVAAGKTVGTLAVWRSGELSGGSSSGGGGSEQHAKALCSGAASLVAIGLQGTRSATGLAWLPQQQQGHPLLLACTQDGAVVSYRLEAAPGGGGLALVAVDGTPQPASGRRKKKEQGHCALGLALSPAGLFVAVARLSLSPAAEIMRSLQVHDRVIQGLLQLDRMAGPAAPLDPRSALEAALQRLARAPVPGGGLQPALAASAAWEVATMLRLQAKWRPAAAEDDQPEAEGVALVPPEAAAVLQQLEQPVLELQHAAAAAPGEELLPRVTPEAWRSLQLATALRHLLHPARVVREQRLRVKKELRVVGGSTLGRPVQPARQQPQQTVVKAEEEVGEEAAAPVQQPVAPALTAEQLAQHGAFAVLLLAPPPPALDAVPPRQPPPPQQRQRQQPQQRQQPPRQQQQAPAAAAEDVEGQHAALLEQWHQATERNEMLLLQRHMHTALAAVLASGGEGEDRMDEDAVPPAAAPAAAAAGSGGGGACQLSQLLMADWITLNVQHPLLVPELIPLAASVYMQAGEEIPETSMPPRETSSLFDAPVAVAGAGVVAATSASCGVDCGGALLARCAASLMLCERRPHWGCRACSRVYREPPAAVAGAPSVPPPPPACIFCGLPLGPVGPALLFSPPCCS